MKKMWLIGGAGVIGAVVLWYFYEQNQAAAAQAALPAPSTGSSSGATGQSVPMLPGDGSSQNGSDYGQESYDNPYGLSPEMGAGMSLPFPAAPPSSGRIMLVHPPTRVHHRKRKAAQHHHMHGLGRHRRHHRHHGGGGGQPEGGWYQAGSPDSAWGNSGDGYFQNVMMDSDIS